MTIVNQLSLLFTHPDEFWTFLRFQAWRRDSTSKVQHPPPGWERPSMRHCWHLLDVTGKSYAPAIKEVGGELAQVLCIFYLVLRGLDTIEDDMTLPNDIKQSILRSFHIHITTPGWHFTGSGPNIKDRQLLLEFYHVIEEVNLLPPKYNSIIRDTTYQMELGMADYAQATADGGGTLCLSTIADYDLYGHYVGGLMGEGLLRTFFACEGGAPCTALQLELSDRWGRCSADFIRDFREDVEEERYLWPKEIWGRPEYGFGGMREMYEAVEADPTSQKARKALYAQSEMVYEALRHAPDSLDFLRLLRKPSVFHFAAKLLCANFAKLDVCFMNMDVFLRDVKVRKVEGVKVLMSATNLHDTAFLLREYARRIMAKADLADPNFLRISIGCEKIEQWYEYHYPSHEKGGKPAFNAAEIRTPLPHIETEYDLRLARAKRRATSTTFYELTAVGATRIGLSYLKTQLSRRVPVAHVQTRRGFTAAVAYFIGVLSAFFFLRSLVVQYGFNDVETRITM